MLQWQLFVNYQLTKSAILVFCTVQIPSSEEISGFALFDVPPITKPFMTIFNLTRLKLLATPKIYDALTLPRQVCFFTRFLFCAWVKKILFS